MVLNKKVRLPLESEWEYSCKAGSSTIFYFGNDTTRVNEYAWYDANTNIINDKSAQPVMLKKPNGWGLYDMHGNVWEWCEDSPQWWNIRNKFIRGGSWLNKPRSLRSSFNASEHVSIVEPHIGFRVLIEE
jgi:formylglycine-generating enzyme required for sulfatase activity